MLTRRTIDRTMKMMESLGRDPMTGDYVGRPLTSDAVQPDKSRGPRIARKTFFGRFKLDNPNGRLHVSNVAREADRTSINGLADSGYPLRWERSGKYARVYYDSTQKRMRVPETLRGE